MDKHIDYWTRLTLQKAYEMRVTTKAACIVSLVEDYGIDPATAKAEVKSW